MRGSLLVIKHIFIVKLVFIELLFMRTARPGPVWILMLKIIFSESITCVTKVSFGEWYRVHHQLVLSDVVIKILQVNLAINKAEHSFFGPGPLIYRFFISTLGIYSFTLISMTVWIQFSDIPETLVAPVNFIYQIGMCIHQNLIILGTFQYDFFIHWTIDIFVSNLLFVIWFLKSSLKVTFRTLLQGIVLVLPRFFLLRKCQVNIVYSNF